MKKIKVFVLEKDIYLKYVFGTIIILVTTKFIDYLNVLCTVYLWDACINI